MSFGKYLYRPGFFAFSVTFLAACAATQTPADRFAHTITVMSFNAWGAGQNTGKGIEETLAVLVHANADVIALQETKAEAEICEAEVCDAAGKSVAASLAESMGYYVYEQNATNAALWSNAILSRFPIRATTPHSLGVTLDIEGSDVLVLNVHLSDYPYQPYQLTGIPYGDAPFLHNEKDAILAAQAARGSALDLLLEDVAALPSAAVIVVCGDFNEPSHLDWTERAARAGRHPFSVRFPASLRLHGAGFVDVFRSVFPDEVARPGFTWTPLADPGATMEHHDRIDFIYARGDRLQPENAAVLGESQDNAEIVVTPWPSDHRAVLVTISF